jgi:dihydroneopterin aldolase
MDAFRPASAALRLRHVFLRDMVLLASVGVHAFEHEAHQRVRINLDLAVTDDSAAPQSRAAPIDPAGDRPAGGKPAGGKPPAGGKTAQGREQLSRVVDYEAVANRVRAIVGAGHVRLLETLAERLAEACLEDARVHTVRVRVEKLDIFDDMESVGVEIERQNFWREPSSSDK